VQDDKPSAYEEFARVFSMFASAEEVTRSKSQEPEEAEDAEQEQGAEEPKVRQRSALSCALLHPL